MGCAGMGGGGGHFVGAGRIRHIGRLHGYEEDWMGKTKKTIEDEVKSRGIAPETISAVVNKIEEPSSLAPVIVAVALTVAICALIFAIVWENT